MLYVTYKKSKLENPIFIMFVIRTSSCQFISEHREREESCDRITDVQEGVKGGGGRDPGTLKLSHKWRKVSEKWGKKLGDHKQIYKQVVNPFL